MYNYLLDKGADPDLQDSLGNTVLHMVVINNKLAMYGYALRHPDKPANNDMLNGAGLTPLTLACTLARNTIFREMLELSSVEFWRYSNVTCSAYPLLALDTILPDGRTNNKSALMIILNGELDEHLDMLEGGVVQRLLEDKWKTFARGYFLRRLGIHFLHLLMLSIAMYLRPEKEKALIGTYDVISIVRYCAEAFVLVACTVFVVFQQGKELVSQGPIGFFMNLTQSPPKFIFLVADILVMMCVPCRIMNLRYLEEMLLTIAVPGSWFYLIFFAGAVRLTGPFVTMIYNMIAGDMVRFGIIYFIFMLSFSQGFFFLYKRHVVEDFNDSGGLDSGDCQGVESDSSGFDTYFSTWMALFHMTLGGYEYKDFGDLHYGALARVVFVTFMVLVPILLLNMLIAMMGNTYSTVIAKSEKEFVKQWAKIVIQLERSIDKENAKYYLHEYAIKIGPPDETGFQAMGLMVIKIKSKTKARQRKGALLNWKRLGKRAIRDMRKYGVLGDQLLSHLGKMTDEEKLRNAKKRETGMDDDEGPGGLLNQLGFNAMNQEPQDDLVRLTVEESIAKEKRSLTNAVEFLAWEHDIDLPKGGFRKKTLLEKASQTSLENSPVYVKEKKHFHYSRQNLSLESEDGEKLLKGSPSSSADFRPSVEARRPSVSDSLKGTVDVEDGDYSGRTSDRAPLIKKEHDFRQQTASGSNIATVDIKIGIRPGGGVDNQSYIDDESNVKEEKILSVTRKERSVDSTDEYRLPAPQIVIVPETPIKDKHSSDSADDDERERRRRHKKKKQEKKSRRSRRDSDEESERRREKRRRKKRNRVDALDDDDRERSRDRERDRRDRDRDRYRDRESSRDRDKRRERESSRDRNSRSRDFDRPSSSRRKES